MCSIGYIRLKNRYLLFKNRDRYPHEEKANYIEENDILAFKDKREPGIWFGVNKHGVGAATAWGPIIDVKDGLEPDNFVLLEEILNSAESRKEAEEMFLEKCQKLGRSYNVILADSSGATEIEYTPDRKSVNKHENFIVKTNHFTHNEDLNIQGARLDNSRQRLILLGKARETEEAENLIPLLGHHGKERIDDVCRHGESVTTASAILEVGEKEVRATYCLNIPPHENNFKVRIWQKQK